MPHPTFTSIEDAIAAIEARGIETRIQHTYFGDEVCIWIDGNVRALIIPAPRFLDWVNAVNVDTLSNTPSWWDAEDDEGEEV